ncbi:MAG: ABC transporter substrate-binding protein [Candidatus Schekmanbacteria bacterium]|nr:MAG: ABC transporter substrate-binding protein [Candidatus Schekmanbacteria bacterium]
MVKRDEIKRIIALLFVFLSLIFLSCSKEKVVLERVRLAFLDSDLHQLAAYVALDRGFFTQQGLQVEVAGIFKAGPEEMSAFSAGEIDIGYVGLAPATIAAANGMADVVLLAQANTEGTSIVVGPDFDDSEGIRSLAGKSIAIPGKGTVQDFLLQKAIEKWQINPIPKQVILKPPEMQFALNNEDIDAYIAWQPYPQRSVRRGKGKILIDSGKIWKDHPCCILVGDRKFIEEDKPRALKIIKVHIMATDYIIENPEKAVEIGVKYTGMERETIRKAIDKIHYTYFPDIEKTKEYLDFLVKFGYVRNVDSGIFIKRFVNEELWTGF